MTARATRRISQPHSYHSAPNRSAITRATYSIATTHSDTTACAAPPAQVVNKRRGRHPATTACAASPAQSTAASLLRGQDPKSRSNPDRAARAASSGQVLGVSASASCGAPTHKGQLKMASKAQQLIGGTAIRGRANRRRFSDLQISNRQQKSAKQMKGARATYSIATSRSDPTRLRSSTRASTAARLRSRPESERPVVA